MLKASLAYHSPEQVYQCLQRQVGPLYMLIKQSHAIIQLQDSSKAQEILDSGLKLKPVLRGIQLKISKYEEGELDRKVVQQHKSQKKQSKKIDGQEIQDESSLSEDQKFLNSIKSRFSKMFQTKLKKLTELYTSKLSEISQNCLDQQLQNHETLKYRSFIQSRIKKYQPQITSALAQILGQVKSYTSGSNEPAVVDLQPVFIPTNLMSMQIEEVLHDDQNAINSPQFKDGMQFINAEGNPIKRICSLNQKNFIVTQRSSKNYNGQVKIFNCQRNQSDLSINIAQGPYSLLCYDSFILVGDYAGKINFINLSDQNSIQASNQLHYGLITQMQKFHNNGEYPSILALLAGKESGGKDTKIKRFQIQTEQITQGINSLSFHPKGEFLCGATTLSFEILDNQHVAYGTEKKLITFNENSKLRQAIVLDYNILKIRKFNQNQLIVSTQGDIAIVDLRIQKQIDKFYTFKYGIKAIEPVSQNYLFFGAEIGQVGVLDRRRTAQILWQNREVHTSRICDLAKVQKSVISGDNTGIIMKWQNIQI